MTEHVQQTIGLVQQQIADLERQVVEKKQMVNGLCTLINQAPIYTETQLQTSTGLGPTRPDEYYGQGLSTAMRMVLERRKLAKLGPATVNDIYDSLIAGGYKFTTNVEEHAKRGLYSTLTKNTATFHRLPNGSYGLLEWYPNAKEAKVASRAAKGTTTLPTTPEPINGGDADDEPFNTDEQAEAALAESEAAKKAAKETAAAK